GGPTARPVPLPIGSPVPVTIPPIGPSPSLPADGGPAWPASVRVPAGYHVFVIGIDMPAGVTLGAVWLGREALGGSLPVGLPVAVPDSPWPDPFAVFGIPSETSADRLQTWMPGIYRLEMQFRSTDSDLMVHTISRTIEVIIEAPLSFPEA